MGSEMCIRDRVIVMGTVMLSIRIRRELKEKMDELKDLLIGEGKLKGSLGTGLERLSLEHL